jgi:flagellar protein FlaI
VINLLYLFLKNPYGMDKIREKLGGKYEGVLVTERLGIEKLRKELKEQLGEEFSDAAIDDYIHKHMSLGKLVPLLLRDDLEEIMVIGNGLPVYVYDSKRGMQATSITLEEGEIREIIQKIARFSGRSVSDASPLLDARLPDGSRVNATLPEVTPKGSTITIRRFRRNPLNIADLIRLRTMSPKLAGFLWLAVEGLRTKPANILISGGAASGKTTTLNVLSSFAPEDERILSVEDVLEVSLRHKHWVPMETKPPIPGGGGEVTMDALVKNALRMRPDRIIVGEVRAEEALTLFTAMNTGHDGCMATIHANSAREAILRLRSHPMNVPDIMIPALDLIVAQRRQIKDGRMLRRVVEVVEIEGREGGVIATNTLFDYDPAGDKIRVRLLNGRLIQQLSTLTNLSIKEIDEEIERREAILETFAKSALSTPEIHEVIQLYYKDREEAVERLYSRVKEAGKREF